MFFGEYKVISFVAGDDANTLSGFGWHVCPLIDSPLSLGGGAYGLSRLSGLWVLYHYRLAKEGSGRGHMGCPGCQGCGPYIITA